MMDGGMMCGGGMAFGGLLVLLLFGLVGYVAYRVGKSRAEGSRAEESGTSAASSRPSDALEIARLRYAQGEIAREEYEQLRRDLA